LPWVDSRPLPIKISDAVSGAMGFAPGPDGNCSMKGPLIFAAVASAIVGFVAYTIGQGSEAEKHWHAARRNGRRRRRR
jgi:hypothetical protein